ncbi:MAG: di-trans,poly-cis-decaprenylcistransferase [Candidatus Nanoclepta minutus]|uniref:Tritrans,polycis-undecaprenyl-diphosphate synthase (geranylgeranyl-diphosphate specific) n=1 Tax=Candidatus Nanoclepta minutus TaxID=1940235 RepID=A0A397WNI3_9ARCH|nr:MAG: di-trans,poly-cis-decaprenylcistransferase [Candidatus Nanoclepta minutus]
MNVLNHIAIIPDGNRRWAKERGLPSYMGHFYGMKKFYEVVKWWLSKDIRIVSFYMLSYENLLNRPKGELENLFKFFDKELGDTINRKNDFLEILEEKEVKVRFVGLLDKLPKNIFEKINKLMDITKDFNRRVLNLLIAYGGRIEIINAIRNMKRFDEEEFRNNLWVKEDVDLIIRTGGYSRLSNLLIYQSAYAELYVINKYWPAITEEDLDKAIEWYSNVIRNFGR